LPAVSLTTQSSGLPWEHCFKVWHPARQPLILVVRALGNKVARFGAISILLLSLAMDIWLVSLLCEFSPDVDWSRFTFGIFVQLISVVGILFAPKIEADLKPKYMLGYVFGTLMLFGLSFVMVRNAALFGDSVDPGRTTDSSGFQCPGSALVIHRLRP
jgi:hypothetical protein